MKRHIAFVVLALTFVLANTAVGQGNYTRKSPFYYELNERGLYAFGEIYEERNSVAEQDKVARDLMRKLEKKFDVTINLKMNKASDEQKNEIAGYTVNVLLKKDLESYFNYEGHRSILIESIAINLLQPFARDRLIKYAVTMVNGVFLEQLGTDVVYSTVMTGDGWRFEDYYDWSTRPDYLKR